MSTREVRVTAQLNERALANARAQHNHDHALKIFAVLVTHVEFERARRWRRP